METAEAALYFTTGMKPNLPVFVGAAVVVAGLGVLLLWQPEPPPQDLAAASLDHRRAAFHEKGMVEGRDYVIDPPVIFRRAEDELIIRLDWKISSGEIGRDYHRLIQGQKGWEFDRDLNRSFRDFVESEKKAACERLGQRLAERYQGAVDIPAENVKIAHRMRESPATAATEPRLVGSIDIRYLDKGGEGRYVEDFTLVNGTWTLEGKAGQLFDRGPRPQ